MVNAQEWLDKEYPKNRRNEITELDISKGKVKRWDGHKRTLRGELKLEGFTNLRKLAVSSHQLTGLDLNSCQFLVELDCQNNQLNSLKVNGCSNLEKVNCFRNYLSGLDLSVCTRLKEINCASNNLLEEVDISKCPKLAKIGFGFTRNSRQGKLIKVSQAVPAGDSIRNILIIGITGNGKSALANTLTENSTSNEFGEGSTSTSVTKSFQKSREPIEYQGKRYRIVDNIGFGDTAKIAKEDILFKIGEGIYSVKEGINQVLFVFKGRFAPEYVKVFNLFKEFISETGIAGFTTLVRTNFEDFRDPEECDKDQKVLLAQSPELVEVIESCNGIVYVDNPSLETEDIEELEMNTEDRNFSREKVLSHLAENCSEIYKLKKWDSIHQQVANCMKRIEEDEERLAGSSSDTEKTRLQKEIKENKGKIAEEVNVALEAEISAFPKLTAKIEMKNPNIWPFNRK